MIFFKSSSDWISFLYPFSSSNKASLVLTKSSDVTLSSGLSPIKTSWLYSEIWSNNSCCIIIVVVVPSPAFLLVANADSFNVFNANFSAISPELNVSKIVLPSLIILKYWLLVGIAELRPLGPNVCTTELYNLVDAFKNNSFTLPSYNLVPSSFVFIYIPP